MPIFKKLSYTAILLLTTLPGVPWAQAFQSHESIRSTAEQTARQIMQATSGDIKLAAGRLDSRLKLIQCNQALEGFTNSFQKVKSNMTIGVRCNDSKGWTLYVPVRSAIFQDVLVVANQVSRNSTVTEADLAFEKRDITRLRKGHFRRMDQLVGKKVKRTLHPGDIITPSMVSTPRQVVRGNRVTILAAAGNILVRMSGKALGSGSIGQRIKVVNASSNREVEAMVVGPDLVKVTL